MYSLLRCICANVALTMTRLDVSIRLRRAITLNDALLVKRIVTQHQKEIRNPDVQDRSNTSLHLAAKLGCVEIAVSVDAPPTTTIILLTQLPLAQKLLIDAGHEEEDISLNTEFETPLMVACEAKQIDMGNLLIERFPRCIPWANKYGMDSVRLPNPHPSRRVYKLTLTSLSSCSPPATAPCRCSPCS
jgi:uncharacterized protein